MKIRLNKQLALASATLLSTSSALAHEGHASTGSLAHSLEHGFWLLSALVVLGGAAALVAYLRDRNRN